MPKWLVRNCEAEARENWSEMFLAWALEVISVLLVSDEMCYNQPAKLSTEEGLLWWFEGIFFQNCDVAAHPWTAHFLRDTKQEPNPGKKKSLKSLPLLWTLTTLEHRWLSYLTIWRKLNTARKVLNIYYAETQGPFFTRKIRAVFTSIVPCPDVKLKLKWMEQPCFSSDSLVGGNFNGLMYKQY